MFSSLSPLKFLSFHSTLAKIYFFKPCTEVPLDIICPTIFKCKLLNIYLGKSLY